MSSISAGTTSTTTLVHSGDTTGSLVFKTNDTGSGGTTAVTIDTAQNVGIGTSSPNIGGANTSNAILSLIGKASTRNGILEMGNLATTGNDQTLGWTRYFDGSTENAAIEVARASSTSTAYMKFSTNGGSGNTERMRIDSSGNLLLQKTSATLSGAGTYFEVPSAPNTMPVYLHFCKTFSGTRDAIDFNYNGSRVGSIQFSDTATSYNTSSDYRLKENIAPMTGALSTVLALKPVTYKWKVDGSDGEGFIAHELAEVKPDCVSGEKDAVDAEGNPVYQGIDTSFLVATLTAAIQELKAINDQQAETINAQSEAIASLTARVVALEGQ